MLGGDDGCGDKKKGGEKTLSTLVSSLGQLYVGAGIRGKKGLNRKN